MRIAEFRAVAVLAALLCGCVGKTGPAGPKGDQGPPAPWPVVYVYQGQADLTPNPFWVSIHELASSKHSTDVYISAGADSVWIETPAVWAGADGQSPYMSTWAEGATGVYLFNWYIEDPSVPRTPASYRIVVTVGS